MKTYTNSVKNRREKIAASESQVIKGREKDMAQNSAGGVSFILDEWKKFERFLVLGSEGGTYYIGEKELTEQNAKNVIACIKKDGIKAVSKIVEISFNGRAHKNDAAIFALSLVFIHGSEEAKTLAAQELPKVCRTGTHILNFTNLIAKQRGFGRSVRNAINNWYISKSTSDLSYQLIKYQNRNGWSHKDVMRLTHPKFSGTQEKISNWLFGKAFTSKAKDAQIINGFEEIKGVKDADKAVDLIKKYGLPRECVPTELMNTKEVIKALLPNMGLTAMIRNLGNMSKADVLKPLSDEECYVMDCLKDKDALEKGRIHPMTILLALKTYESGHGFKGTSTWSVNPRIVKALNDSFYLSFKTFKPSNKRFVLGLDISGSMGSLISGTNISCSEASAAMALITEKTEPKCLVGVFNTSFDIRNISSCNSIQDTIKAFGSWTGGGTSCSAPIVYALDNNIPADAFVIYTDGETYAGNIQPSLAIKEYRKKMGIPAKLIVVGMASNGFSIADPNDAGMLDIVGFDSETPTVISSFLSE